MEYKTFNEWFLSLAEEEQAVIREDKWTLAGRGFMAGRASGKASSRDVIVEELLKAALEYADWGDGDSLEILSDVAIKYAKHKGEINEEEKFIPRKMKAIKSVEPMIVAGEEFIEISPNIFRNSLYPDGDCGLDFGYLESAGWDMSNYFIEIGKEKYELDKLSPSCYAVSISRKH